MAMAATTTATGLMPLICIAWSSRGQNSAQLTPQRTGSRFDVIIAASASVGGTYAVVGLDGHRLAVARRRALLHRSGVLPGLHWRVGGPRRAADDGLP